MKIQTWIAAVAGGVSLSAHGALYSYDFTVTGGAIPDANPSGFVNNQTITDSMQGNAAFQPSPYIVNVVGVRLTVTGGWNGDLYAYLRYETDTGTGFSTLLNRVGTGPGNPIGSTVAGFNNITLTAGGSPNIHDVANPVLDGSYGGDGTSFSSFNGLNPTTGTWSIFFADLSGSHVSTLTEWGLDLEVVPEPVNVALGIVGGIVVIGGLVRARLQKKQKAEMLTV